MIELVPFNKTVFDDFNIKKYKISRYTYINNIDLVSKLLTIKIPIENRKLFLRNMLDFLSYIDNKKEDIMSLHSNTLISFFSRDTYKRYIDILAELNVMTRVPYENKDKKGKDVFYEKGSLSCRYRIHNNYIKNEDLCIIILEDDRGKIKFNNEIPNLDQRYINTIKKLEVNIPLAIEAELNNFRNKNLPISVLKKRIASIFYTIRKRFIKKGKKVDRIYHSFTNLSRISRNYLNINFNSMDIVNCQPLLLVAFLKKNNLIVDDNYQKDCEEGLFYEKFIDIKLPNELNTEQGRKEWRNSYTKKNIYKNLFFGFNKKSEFNKKFKQLYPLVWNALNDINDSEISLASRLQNVESELFNNLIPQNSKYYYTLFDAIYFDNILDKKELEENIYSFFNELNIKVKIDSKIGKYKI